MRGGTAWVRSGGRGPEDPRAQGVSLLWVVTVSDEAAIFTEVAKVTSNGLAVGGRAVGAWAFLHILW